LSFSCAPRLPIVFPWSIKSSWRLIFSLLLLMLFKGIPWNLLKRCFWATQPPPSCARSCCAVFTNVDVFQWPRGLSFASPTSYLAFFPHSASPTSADAVLDLLPATPIWVSPLLRSVFSLLLFSFSENRELSGLNSGSQLRKPPSFSRIWSFFSARVRPRPRTELKFPLSSAEHGSFRTIPFFFLCTVFRVEIPTCASPAICRTYRFADLFFPFSPLSFFFSPPPPPGPSLSPCEQTFPSY